MFRGFFSIKNCSLAPMGLLVALAFTLVAADIANAQPGGGRQRGGRGGGFGGGGGSVLGLLGSDKVLEEIEASGDQIESIQALQQEQRSSIQEMFAGMRDRFRDVDPAEREELMTEVREKMEANNKDFEERVYEELLPHQIERIKQLQRRSNSRRSGGLTGGATMSEDLIEELGITEEQLEKMKAKAESVREELTKKMNELRSQAETEILSVLDPEQREKYQEMMGDEFEFEQPRFGRGQRGGGGNDRRDRRSEEEKEDDF